MATDGLEGVVAGRSALCSVDGAAGTLTYRGISIHDLAQHASFEEVAYLLWFDALPTAEQLARFRASLARERALPPGILSLLRGLPLAAPPMDVLRTAVSALALYDPDRDDDSREANVRKSIRLTAQIPTIVTAYHRLRAGREVIASRPELGHAASFLYMLNGSEPDEIAARALDVALILQADHELNASTFAARVTAATLADMHAAITAGLGALSGPLHGGANEGVIQMLMEIGSPEGIEPYIREALAEKRKIMGFGHRVYKTGDPRVTHLRQMSEALGRRARQPVWFEISRRIEEFMGTEKRLHANVDFYSASVFHVLGIPRDLFTPVFAVSRIAGWTAHVLEQYSDNRLIRPRAEYIGPVNRPYVPIERR
jgi:citrate synthase